MYHQNGKNISQFCNRRINMSKYNVKNLTIEELCIYDSSRYIVPIYQRNYAWGDKEIRELIQDINTAMKRNQGKNYYLGSLVVCRKDDGIFEVIDGQQRLTTLNILLACLGYDKRIPLGFKHRRAADESLEKLTKIPDIALLDKNDSIQEGYIIAKNIFQDYDIKINKERFKNFLLKNVRIIQTEVPHDTNLNHYFEIMNNRGEQLEKHEILKTRLMNILDNSSRYTFAKIWDACSDMQRYAIMSIKSDVREQIFGKNWTLLPKDFKEIIDIYHKNIDLDNNVERIIDIVKKYIKDEKDNFKYIKKVEASEFRVEDNYILYGQIDLILEDENEIKIIDFKTGKYNEIEFSSNYRQQLSLYKLLLQKKYDKEIKTYLYYLEEDESKKEILIDDEDLKEDFENINKTVQDILNKKFPKIPYNQNICGLCEFKNYCWGIQ